MIEISISRELADASVQTIERIAKVRVSRDVTTGTGTSYPRVS